MGRGQAQGWNCPGQKRKTHAPSWHSELNSQVIPYPLIFFSQQAQEIKNIWIESWLPRLLAVTGHIIEPL